MSVGSMSLLKRLKKAARKIKFLLSFNMSNWLLWSASSKHCARANSGLLEVAPEAKVAPTIERTMSSTWAVINRTLSGLAGGLEADSRTTSGASGVDVDERAEAFIAGFYRRLQMEKQVSLELRYATGRTSSELSLP